MLKRFSDPKINSDLILSDQTITAKEILRTYCLATNAISIIPREIKDDVKDRFELKDYERYGTFRIACVPNGLSEFQKTLLNRLAPLATKFSILWPPSYYDAIVSFEKLDEKVDYAFIERVVKTNLYYIEPHRIDFTNPLEVDKYKREFEQFLIGVFFPQMLINEVPVADEIIKEFVRIAKIKTTDFVDPEHEFWNEFESENELCKICSIPAYIIERNKQMLLGGALESDLIASNKTVLRMQEQIDMRCLRSECKKCKELLRNFFDSERPENTETKIRTKDQKKLR